MGGEVGTRHRPATEPTSECFGRPSAALRLSEDLVSYVMLDIEADSPIPGDYAMSCSSTAIMEPSLATTFYGLFLLTSEQQQPEALGISDLIREQPIVFPEPEDVVRKFVPWLPPSSVSAFGAC